MVTVYAGLRPATFNHVFRHSLSVSKYVDIVIIYTIIPFNIYKSV